LGPRLTPQIKKGKKNTKKGKNFTFLVLFLLSF
jgi:hypothetical protein